MHKDHIFSPPSIALQAYWVKWGSGESTIALALKWQLEGLNHSLNTGSMDRESGIPLLS